MKFDNIDHVLDRCGILTPIPGTDEYVVGEYIKALVSDRDTLRSRVTEWYANTNDPVIRVIELQAENAELRRELQLIKSEASIRAFVRS